MNRLYRIISASLSAAMLLTTILPSAVSAQYERRDRGEEDRGFDEMEGAIDRAVVEREEGGWSIVDTRTVTGRVVVLSPVVGREIDLDEGVRFSMFQGPSEFNRLAGVRFLATSVPGFRNAVFMTRGEGRYGVRIEFESGGEVRHRVVRVPEDDLRKAREYVENFIDIRRRNYKIEKRSKIEDDEEYPKVTEEEISFETSFPRFVLARRIDGGLVLRDGRELDGELVPAFDDGQIVLQQGFDTLRIPVENIESIRTSGSKSSTAARRAVRSGIGGAFTGALIGALISWQGGGDIGSNVLLGTTIFGIAGLITGFVTGAGQGRSARVIPLDPPERKGGSNRQDEDDR